MHVHVSMGKEADGTDITYSTDQIRHILKQVVYFDAPLTKLMPPARKNNTWAESNVNYVTKWKNLHGKVPEASWTPLFRSFDEAKTKDQLLRDLISTRCLSWNFKHILSKCGTVEFRRPPGVQTAQEAIKWTAFAIAYIAHAVWLQDWNRVRATKTYPSTNELRAAIAAGLGKVGLDPQKIVGDLKDDEGKAPDVSQEELAQANKEKRAKEQKKSIFVEKVQYTIYVSTSRNPS